eukprot:CAMPEP_0116884564 /NCGR_PEP_ID=MMETSP0463-20121206/17507_1 /TAXON_ID=181622 /ORGANISM="Strombidinopsis sp, Strain SopsisLIS2011" /LENGTH=32 /DNA_ID= /DNA_START= /DNA_END= /DNA_ORIENTATION=
MLEIGILQEKKEFFKQRLEKKNKELMRDDDCG